MNEKNQRKKEIRNELSAYLREDPDRAGDSKTQELLEELEAMRGARSHSGIATQPMARRTA